MRKLLLFLCLLFCSCGRLKAPVGPNATVAFEGIIEDAESGELIENETVLFGSTEIHLQEKGRFRAILNVNNQNNIIVTLFPYEPVLLPLDNIRENPEKVKIKLRLPPLLRQYNRILQKAAQNDYRIVSIKEWHQRPEIENSSKIIVMRHDVDFDALYAKALGYLEHKQGVHSTYFFRWLTADEEAINYVKKMGHEVGLHYETLATYAEKRNIYNRHELSQNIYDICRLNLKKEIEQFEYLYGDIYSISSHGAAWNRMMGISNVILTKGQNLEDFGVKVDGSHLELIPGDEQIFVADSGGKWAPYSVEQAIEEGHHRIYCLIHPVWWRERKSG